MIEDETTTEAGKTPGPLSGREGAGLLAVALVAAGLRTYRLDQNGTGNPYYGASARSMLASGTNFFFGSFDPLGIVTVDKPPVALWIQALSARLFGYGGLAVLLPQALMGVGSVVLTWYLVRRIFGAAAGLLAALALAVTPICVAIDRDNLPDTALVFVLLLATWALSRAASSGRVAPLMGAMALVGLAFNVKMLAAFVVLPTFALAYWLAAPVGWRAKLARLAASGAVLVATSLSWSIAVELTPKDRRPYIGGSRGNSALELALGYNGIARIMGMGGFGPPGMRPPGLAGSATPKKSADAKAEAMPPPPPGGPGMGPPPFGPGGMPGFGGTPGFARFANRGMAGLITWLFPMAVLGSLAAMIRSRWTRPVGREHLALAIWGGWFATHWLVFSFARGIFHEYYTTAMGPAVAALAGIGAVALFEESRRGGWRAALLPSVVLLTATWQEWIVGHYPDWKHRLLPTLLAGSTLGSAGLVASRWLAARWSSVPWARISAGVGLATLFVCPAVWSSTAMLAPGISMMPTADPTLLGARSDWPGPASPFGPGGPMDSDPEESRRLVAFLRVNRRGESILVAALASMAISPIIIESGEPAVALGGFMGGDPAMSKDRFVKLVEDGRLRFFLTVPGPGGGGPPGGPGGPMMGNREIMEWVREHGQVVDAKLWKGDVPDEEPEAGPPINPRLMFARMRRMAQLYDLRPGTTLVAAP